MSDQDLILRVLRQAQARIRTNRILERLAGALAVWTGVGILVKLVDLAFPFGLGLIRFFWIFWVAGASVVFLWSLRCPQDLRLTAEAVDRRARLDDEVLSAWWFISHPTRITPWIELHVHRAAAKIRDVDVSALWPRVLPRMSYVAALGLVALVGLHFVPISGSPVLSLADSASPPGEFSEAEGLMEEIEELLERAEALDPDGSLGAFQSLMNDVSDVDVPTSAITSSLDDLASSLDEGNLTTAGILEGLEDMAQELMGADETSATGEALAGGDLGGAAGEFDRLADAIAVAGTPAADVAEALARAAGDSRAGLEDLAQSMSDAAEALGRADTAAAGESLADAAEALRDLSNVIESQNLRNQASDRIDNLQEALEGRGAGGDQPGQDAPDEPQAGSSSSSEEGQPGGAMDSASGESDQSGAGESAPPGEAQPGDAATRQPGNIEGAAGGDSGLIPAGLGFSPEQKTGQPTSLEVRLEQESTEAQTQDAERSGELPPRQEATRQERSRLDYRNVPSELTPAQQELLGQERVPREYRNLIRDYFQAIRPTIER